MNVAVIGIGRIGLPLSAAIAGAGHQVFGCDINAERVALVNRGENPIPDEAGLGDLLRRVVASGNLRATTDTIAAVGKCEAVLFAVAVDVNDEGTADLTPLFAAADTVGRGIRPGTLCIFDTTLPIGTTRAELAPRLESGGLKLGRDFSVAFSPERLLMGRVIEDLKKYPKLVGGVDPDGGPRAAAFYKRAFGDDANVRVLANAETAELTKLAEGAYRDLNIALANELAQVADAYGIDIAEVTGAANSQPYSHIHTPGTGVGGHCIPVYPRFLIQGRGPSALSSLGRDVNDAMPRYAAERVAGLIGGLEGKRVLILGLTFRPNVAVTPHTNAVDLLREFAGRGALVHGHDALLSEAGVRSLGFEPAAEPLAGYDVAVVHAYHDAYQDYDWRRIAPLVLDARNAMDRTAVEAAGVRYLGIGRPVSVGE
ncbi:MAG: nucleotide sugar dehydrogenase [Dehalococcoidia bacterium]|nr:nucleotide sugar dehydrogenase [Dehalococcoidia bacterium]